MAGPSQLRTLVDLVNELTSGGRSQREAALQTIRDIENGDVICLDPHQNPGLGIRFRDGSLASAKPRELEARLTVAVSTIRGP